MYQNGKGLFGSTGATGAKKKQGFDFKRAAGILGDFALGLAGQPGQYGPMMERRRLIADRDAQRQRERAQDFADWERKQRWELENPAPQEPTAVQRNHEWYAGLSDEQKAIYHEMRPEYRQGPDGRFYRVDVAPQGEQDLGENLPQGWTIDGGGTAGNGGGTFR